MRCTSEPTMNTCPQKTRPSLSRSTALRILAIAGVVAFVGGTIVGFNSGCSNRPAPVAPAEKLLTPEQVALNVQSFDQVWTIIRDKHYDPTLGGLDWNAVKTELRPKVESATTLTQARSVMNDMAGRLGQSHFGIIPGDAYDDQPAADSSSSSSPSSNTAASATSTDSSKPESIDDESGTTGIHVRAVNGQALVTKVEPGSPADKAGVRPGWIIQKIGSSVVADSLARFDTAFAARPKADPSAEHVGLATAKAMMLESRFRGNVGDSISATFLDAKDRKKSLDLTFAPLAGTPAVFGNLPPINVTFESRRLENNIGYITFNIFLDPATVMPKFNEAMASFADTDGLIIDLRGNVGGLGAMSMGMGSWFVTEPNKRLGVMKTRSGEIRFVLNRRAKPYTKPVAILVDELSVSTSEIMAGGFQDLKLARIFGTRTAGAALPSNVEVLPNGDRFQYVFADYTSDGGQKLEGRGVIPDVTINPDRAALLAGRDNVLDAATQWIASGGSSASTPQPPAGSN